MSPQQKRILFVGTFLLLVSTAPSGMAEDPDPRLVFKEANAAYLGGSYDPAESLYRGLLKRGFDDPAVYYNLGNACFKKKQIGQAILYYEKAKKRDPRNADILANLKFATSLLEYRIEDKRNWYERAVIFLMQSFKFKEIALCTLLLGALFWIEWGILLALRPEAGWGWRQKGLGLLFLAGLALAGLKEGFDMSVREAIVLKPQAAVRYGPSYKDQTAFKLAEGMKVLLQRKSDTWRQISLPSGETGWIPEEDLEVV